LVLRWFGRNQYLLLPGVREEIVHELFTPAMRRLRSKSATPSVRSVNARDFRSDRGARSERFVNEPSGSTPASRSPSLVGPVRAANADVRTRARASHADEPRIAAHLAVLDERPAYIFIDMHLDLLPTVGAGYREGVHLHRRTISECASASPARLPAREISWMIHGWAASADDQGQAKRSKLSRARSPAGSRSNATPNHSVSFAVLMTEMIRWLERSRDRFPIRSPSGRYRSTLAAGRRGAG